MADIDPIIVQITAEFGDLKKDLADVKKGIKGVGTSAKAESGSMKEMGESFAFASLKMNLLLQAAQGIITAIPSLITQQIKASKETNLWANRLDVAADKFSQLTIVARKFGGSTDDVGDSIKDLNERIADAARGNKTYEEALGMVGLASKELIRLPVEEQFLKVADAIGKMSNAGDRNFVTAELMADAGFRLIPMFQQGEGAIRGMMKSADELNQSLDTKQIEAFASLDKEFIALEISTETLAKTMGESLAPILEESARLAGVVADEITKMFESQKELKSLNVADQLSAQIEKLSGLKMALVSAQGELLGFEDSWSRALMISGDEDKLVLEGNVERLKATIAATTAEIERLKTAKDGADLSTGGESGGGSGGVDNSDAEANAVRVGLEAAAAARQEYAAQEIIDQILQNELKEEMAAEYQELKLNREFEEMLILGEQREQMRTAEEEAQKAFMDREFGAAKRQIDRLKSLEKSGWQGRFKMGMEFTQNIAAALDDGSRKSFERTKKLNMAEAVINTIGGVTKALNNPYPVNLLFAASVAAAGAAQIAKISSSSYGGGSGGGAAGVPEAVSAPEAAQAQTVSNFDVTLQGDNFGGDGIRSLIAQINGELDDGATIGRIGVR
jgi:hypothetical protein